MTLGEFDIQLKRLKDTYKGYPSEVQKLLYKQIKDFSTDQFELVVDELITSEGRTPSVKLIVSKFVRVREGLSKTYKIKHWSNDYGCNSCNDSGWEFIHDPNYFNTVVRCSCSKGRAILIPFNI